MSSGKNSDIRAIKENRELHLSNLKRRQFNDLSRLERMRLLEIKRRQRRAALEAVTYDLGVHTPEEREALRREAVERVRHRAGWFGGGGLTRRTDVA